MGTADYSADVCAFTAKCRIGMNALVANGRDLMKLSRPGEN